ncbi:hypothetical protein LBMAG32_05240 [Nitrosomonadaceae bacterium]|nr:DUF192 domain-containing protein [Nitrosospira sp.]MDW7642260.1 DUF192 domain-containing protein [Nitrosomonadaceae bacterium]MDW7653529.1 DUF192 domain-containing protein [Nitrosomonadaceae bacterium]MDW7663701.1 DUF192 domain-containing protein [Nitrosomonadaceae bacterium]MDW7665297.1 DUF192 domain-containing protein [Nitrosomonadaceae bacterium]
MMRFLLIIVISILSIPASAETPLIDLKISSHTLSVEVSYTKASRERGLMYRKSMKKNNGMLFVFPEVGYHNIWMLNTSIPLSVAFLDKNGVILNITNMIPHTQTIHSPNSPAKYVIETNLGWFETKKIKPGHQVAWLKEIPTAE